ncbi:MAG: signal peptide peptidase SppA, partial [Victivallales bacterium]|nr:signal peptide peptidase SppA [Victivallales bacterium]
DGSMPRLRPLEESASSGNGNTTNNYYYQQAPQPPKKGGFLKKLFVFLLVVFLIFAFFGGLIVLGICGVAAIASSFEDFDSESEKKVKETVRISGDEDNQVAVIEVKGIIARAKMSGVACSEKIVDLIDHVRENKDNYCALIIDMDTPGGEVIAADEIYGALRKLKKEDEKFPVVTCMHSMGASGGYYVAAATDYIIANRMTFTGSIGVIMSSYNISDLIGKIGISEQVFRSGDMKDMMSSTRKMTEKERIYMQKMINDTFNEFAGIVASGREAYKTAEDVKAAPFGDGRVLSGAEALEYKLVDELGGFDETVKYVQDKLGLENKPQIVQLNNKSSFFDSLLEMRDKLPLQTSLVPGNTFMMKAGYLYFLLPTTTL